MTRAQSSRLSVAMKRDETEPRLRLEKLEDKKDMLMDFPSVLMILLIDLRWHALNLLYPASRSFPSHGAPVGLGTVAQNSLHNPSAFDLSGL